MTIPLDPPRDPIVWRELLVSFLSLGKCGAEVHPLCHVLVVGKTPALLETMDLNKLVTLGRGSPTWGAHCKDVSTDVSDDLPPSWWQNYVSNFLGFVEPIITVYIYYIIIYYHYITRSKQNFLLPNRSFYGIWMNLEYNLLTRLIPYSRLLYPVVMRYLDPMFKTNHSWRNFAAKKKKHKKTLRRCYNQLVGQRLAA